MGIHLTVGHSLLISVPLFRIWNIVYILVEKYATFYKTQRRHTRLRSSLPNGKRLSFVAYDQNAKGIV